jgi:hypothetical protein
VTRSFARPREVLRRYCVGTASVLREVSATACVTTAASASPALMRVISHIHKADGQVFVSICTAPARPWCQASQRAAAHSGIRAMCTRALSAMRREQSVHCTRGVPVRSFGSCDTARRGHDAAREVVACLR